MKFHPTLNPRFVWTVGAIHEQFPDVSQDLTAGLHLYDRQERKVVVTVHAEYAQAMCLETTITAEGCPFTNLELWFNELSNEALTSENLPPTHP